MADIARFIAAHLPVETVPGVPEIRLHRANARSGLSRLAETSGALAAPYWAHLWGGGLALARHLIDRPACVAGRRVLDFGCGGGLVGIAAAMSGAQSVLAVDIDPNAVAATQLNAALNDVALMTDCVDITIAGPPAVDVILVGDVFYEAGLAERVGAFLDCCRAAHIDVIVGDPYRTTLPRSRLSLIAEYANADFDEAERKSGVFAFL